MRPAWWRSRYMAGCFFDWRGTRYFAAVGYPWCFDRGQRLPKICRVDPYGGWRIGYLLVVPLGPSRRVRPPAAAGTEYNPPRFL